MITIEKSGLESLVMLHDGNLKYLTEMRQYYGEKAGVEHYRLLTAISNGLNEALMLDVGTYKGASALALGNNRSNRVISYNVFDQLDADFSDMPNVTFRIKDIYTERRELILNSNLILFDIAPHNGSDETNFYTFLRRIDYKGTVIFDDIKLNGEMEEFWKNINMPKLDLSEVGHSSGTGAVFFGEINIEIK